MEAPQRRTRQPQSSGFAMIIILAALFLVMTYVMVSGLIAIEPKPNESLDSTEPPEATTTTPTGPYITASASIGVTGDVLPHGPVIQAAQDAAGVSGEYDFTGMFRYITPYFSSYDCMIANFETTLGGTAAGAYAGYPNFNCPDSIIDALQGAGVDMLLTGNNHSYDTGDLGFFRTMEVLEEKGMDFLGTVPSQDTPFYTVKDINGIKIGMVSYTFNTGINGDGQVQLNGMHTMSVEASQLISTFHNTSLENFYGEITKDLADMKDAGAEFNIVFMHWGTENKLYPDAKQQEVAQALCEFGVDIIVGGHPHIIQPLEVLTSSTGHKTYCIYSTGNTLSNQRRDTLTSENKEYTEDGLIFGMEFIRWDDGTTEISDISVLPMWVNKEEKGDNKATFTIIPLDPAVESWTGYDVSIPSRLSESYNRTLFTLGDNLNDIRISLGQEAIPTFIEE